MYKYSFIFCLLVSSYCKTNDSLEDIVRFKHELVLSSSTMRHAIGVSLVIGGSAIIIKAMSGDTEDNERFIGCGCLIAGIALSQLPELYKHFKKPRKSNEKTTTLT